MDDSSVKQKQGAPPRPKSWGRLIILALAVGLCLIFREIILSTPGFPRPCQGTVFYPLLLLTHYPPLQIVLWLSIILLFIGLHALAFKRRAHTILILIAFLAGAGLLIDTWTASGPPISLIASDTYAEEGVLYRLVYVSGEGVAIENERIPIRVFVLLQCDSLGWGRCDVLGTADMTVGGMQSLTEAEIATAHLYLDVTHDMLVLQMGEGMGWENMRAFIGCMVF